MIGRLWDAQAPFIYRERELRKTDFWVYFKTWRPAAATTQ